VSSGSGAAHSKRGLTEGAGFSRYVSERNLLPALIFKSIQLGDWLVRTGITSKEMFIEALLNEIQTGERLAYYLHRKGGLRLK